MGFLVTSLEGGNFRVSLADGGELFLETAPALPGTGTVTNVTGSAPIVITGSPTATPNVTVTPATDLAPGSMSAADKTKLDAIQPLAVPLFGNVQAIDNQASPVVFNGFVFAAFKYTPLVTGIVEFSFAFQGTANLIDSVTLEVIRLTAGTITGGTAVGGITYAIGSVPVVGGTAVDFVAFQTGAIAAAGAAFIGGPTVSGLFQLTAGVTYTFKCSAVGGTTGRNYTAMTVGVAMREVPAS